MSARLLSAAAAALAALAAVLLHSAPPAQAQVPAAESDYSSFFTDDALRGSGWRSCPTPVTWSVDTGRLSADAARKEVTRLRKALHHWSEHTGVPLAFAGRQRLVYDNSSYLLRSAEDQQERTRHIYIGFYTAKEVPGLSGNVVGLARPTSVLTAERELVSGMAVFRRGYVLREQIAEPRHLTHLYLHELGHIWGLGHAESPANVMYPTLGTVTELGPGDRAGARAHTQECAATTG